ncbi:hypothetical protein [Chryseobacterium luteum]|uniref:Uncharacterized protein n=1 Tax=Chryseobacterium luteum TaxID=421531 RepID=A0A085ZX74_9FLAO|nr:hypothetical protein [Chryseobacterium luteum]KFF09038.1 hypothetical protein IX38_00535 [Chryseobacterium luteum]
MKPYLKIINIILFTAIQLCYSQNKIVLDSVRVSVCKKKCKTFTKELLDKKNNNSATPSFMLGTPKYLKMFSISSKVRMNIYPFNEYDSIYIAKPTFIKDIEEPRNYLQEKYHNSVRILTEDEKIKLSDILFNYHKTYDLYRIGERSTIGCDCIQLKYPKIILLFKKAGQFKKYIAFPDDGWNRYNLTDEEYQNFDWSEEKENVILDMLKKDILPNQKKN